MTEEIINQCVAAAIAVFIGGFVVPMILNYFLS